MTHQKILILDFGSQYTQLIARRVRECSVYCELHPFDVSAQFVRDFKFFHWDCGLRWGSIQWLMWSQGIDSEVIMEVSVREFKSHLSRYLHLAEEGGEVVVTSRQRQMVRLTPCEAGSGELPSIPGVRWKTQRPDLSKPVAERPINLSEPLSDWVVANRR